MARSVLVAVALLALGACSGGDDTADLTTTTTLTPTQKNIGVYTNPEHDLWVAETSPSKEEVENGEALKEGEITVAVKSTGICG